MFCFYFSSESLEVETLVLGTSCASDKSETPSSKSQRIVKKRKYDENYLSFGFMEADGSPQCVLCNKVLPNSSMFPAKMLRHFQSVHPEHRNKKRDFFVRKREDLLKTKKFMTQASQTVNEKATEASYLVSYKIAQTGESHTIAETLIKPCTFELVKCMLDEKSAKQISVVPLSNDTVARRIKDLAENVKTELISRLKCRKFALQMDESTDVAGLAVLLVFVRYQYEHSIEEDLLLCKALETNTTGEEIFKLVNSYLNQNEIPWDNCVDICTDGAKAMVGKTAGAVARIKAVAKNCSSSHCIIHRQALAAKNMPFPLKTVLDESVKIINFIKSRPLNMRLFKTLCDDMGSMHTSLLLHTEVRWLSRGKILLRLFELRSEVRAFFMDHPFDLANRLTQKEWLFRLSYLTDIFSKLNEVNLSLQGKQTTAFTANDKIQAFKRKLEFWMSSIQCGRFDSFPALKEFSEETETGKLSQELTNEIIEHLKCLHNSVSQYFPEEWDNHLRNYSWVKNPYVVSEKPHNFSSQEYEKFIDMTSDSVLKTSFENRPLAEFWCGIQEEYPEMTRKAISVLLPFISTYLCEAGFSSYVSTKTKYRNRLNAESDMRLQLSSIKPNIKELCSYKKQHHSSH